MEQSDITSDFFRIADDWPYHVMAKPRGVTLDSTVETTLGSNIPGATTGNFSGNPQYCFGKVT